MYLSRKKDEFVMGDNLYHCKLNPKKREVLVYKEETIKKRTKDGVEYEDHVLRKVSDTLANECEEFTCIRKCPYDYDEYTKDDFPCRLNYTVFQNKRTFDEYHNIRVNRKKFRDTHLLKTTPNTKEDSVDKQKNIDDTTKLRDSTRSRSRSRSVTFSPIKIRDIGKDVNKKSKRWKKICERYKNEDKECKNILFVGFGRMLKKLKGVHYDGKRSDDIFIDTDQNTKPDIMVDLKGRNNQKHKDVEYMKLKRFVFSNIIVVNHPMSTLTITLYNGDRTIDESSFKLAFNLLIDEGHMYVPANLYENDRSDNKLIKDIVDTGYFVYDGYINIEVSSIRRFIRFLKNKDYQN
jgi:hypothetical protein